MIDKFFKLFVIIAVSILLLAVSVEGYLGYSAKPKNVSFQVKRGASLRSIALRLGQKEVVKLPWVFMAYATILNVQNQIKAGDYLFNEEITPRELLKRLLQGEVRYQVITFLEGWTYKQMASYLEGLSFLKEEDFAEKFLALCEDPSFIGALDLNATNLEGYLFPDTYKVSESITPEEFIRFQIMHFNQNYKKNLASLVAKSRLSKHEIVTLASIIQKETYYLPEIKRVASVFHNRLKVGMLLQADPTIIYGLEDFDGNLRKKDISNRHVYNTYVHKGLPPGPIANPGLEALLAAANPEQSDYYYFVAKGDGSHYFSKNLKEHNRAVRKYQLK